MKNTLLLSIIFSIFSTNYSPSQVTLSAGDIVVLQYNSDGGSDELVFLPLVDIPANSIIYFSDAGWNSASSDFGSATERGIKYTVNGTGLTAGTLIKLLNPTGALYALEPSSLGSLEFYEVDGSVETGSSRELTLSTSGDQVLIFQTTDGVVTSSKTFIYGFNTRSTTGYVDGWQADGNALNSTSTDSHLPPSLIALNSTQSNKTTATAFGISGLSGAHIDNWQYTGPFTAATKDEWLQRIHTLANWSSNDGAVFSHGDIASGTSSVIVSSTLGVSNFESKKIKISPNPSSDYIQISGMLENEKYTLYSILGTEIKKGVISNNEQIDIRGFMNGLYFLKFENGNTIKFLKE